MGPRRRARPEPSEADRNPRPPFRRGGAQGALFTRGPRPPPTKKIGEGLGPHFISGAHGPLLFRFAPSGKTLNYISRGVRGGFAPRENINLYEKPIKKL